MSQIKPSFQDPAFENLDLHARLEAAEDMVRAIRSNEVDAVVVGPSGGERIYSLGGADECYRTFVEAMGEGALTITRDGEILYCNRHFGEMVGLPAEQLLGSSIYEFAGPENEGVLRALIWEGLATAKATREFALRRSDGSNISAALTVTPLVADGATNACVLVHDLTDHEARLAAEAMGVAKDRFLALLSHEIRTPLTPVLMAITTMEQNATLPAEMRPNLEMMRRNIALELILIDDLLDFSRAISGKMRLRLEPLGVHSLVQTVLEMLKPDVTQKRLNVVCKLSADSDLVNGDSARLQQLLWNLMKNAIKFSNEDGKIAINSYRGSSDMLIVEVRDQGMGIDPSTMSRIFDPFEQGQNATTQRAGGLGLGLTIAKAVVEAHGGAIRAESDGIGRGAKFVFELPMAAQSAAPDVKMTAPQSPQGATSQLRILLAEDHQDTAEALRRLLLQLGHQVTVADSVSSALKLASASTFDLVVSDIGLPDGTGYDLMRQIRQNCLIPGIALTGYGMEVDVKSSVNAGFSEHVTKPVELAHLVAVIDRVAGNQNTPKKQ